MVFSYKGKLEKTIINSLKHQKFWNIVEVLKEKKNGGSIKVNYVKEVTSWRACVQILFKDNPPLKIILFKTLSDINPRQFSWQKFEFVIQICGRLVSSTRPNPCLSSWV